MIRKLSLEVDDVVRNAESGGHPPSVVEIVDRAARSKADLSLTLPLRMIVELHRKADHLVTRLREQGSRHRRVDSARHCDDNTHISMVVGFRFSVFGFRFPVLGFGFLVWGFGLETKPQKPRNLET